jgi:hypothetical protein
MLGNFDIVTGHTHEDIDAVFGVVSRLLRGQHVKTLAQFANIITGALNGNSLVWEVKDVMVVPDYRKFLEPCIDTKIANLHKKLQVVNNVIILLLLLLFLTRVITSYIIYYYHILLVLQTQHQWRFEAVPHTAYFPMGCKTTYRAYSSDNVVAFKIKAPAECMTPMGRATGLEPVKLESSWMPSATCDDSRGLL